MDSAAVRLRRRRNVLLRQVTDFLAEGAIASAKDSYEVLVNLCKQENLEPPSLSVPWETCKDVLAAASENKKITSSTERRESAAQPSGSASAIGHRQSNKESAGPDDPPHIPLSSSVSTVDRNVRDPSSTTPSSLQHAASRPFAPTDQKSHTTSAASCWMDYLRVLWHLFQVPDIPRRCFLVLVISATLCASFDYYGPFSSSFLLHPLTIFSVCVCHLGIVWYSEDTVGFEPVGAGRNARILLALLRDVPVLMCFGLVMYVVLPEFWIGPHWAVQGSLGGV